MPANTAALIAPGVITDPSRLMKDYDDEIMSAGSLMLIDPTHPAAPSSGYVNSTSGAPADGALVPNIAYKPAAALVGGGAGLGSLSPAVGVGSAFTTPNLCKIERSSKGGIHVIAPQPGTYMANRHVRLPMPANVRAYMKANPTNDFFVSIWHRVTRLTTQAGVASHSTLGAGLADAFFYFGSRPTAGGEVNYPVANRIGTRGALSTGAVGNTIQNAAWSAVAGTVAASYDTNNYLWAVGDNYGSGLPGKSFSDIFYRMYIEDLTVSGRTYATVDALDYAAYTREVLTTGGRYYNDTFTDPTTVV